MRPRLSYLLVAVWGVVMGLTISIFPAFQQRALAHSGCTVTQEGDVQIWKGDDHANTCNAGDGKDSMFGYGAGDDLGGQFGRDEIRGATGGDHLTDNAGGNDTDGICDGSGADTTSTYDGDGNDTTYGLVDSSGDNYEMDGGDGFFRYDANNCPI
ncbi:MAG TPA: hypothetical protein VEM93_05185 [Actinomycetota bacterium]|nr:hypothetical protein [Actinomycetota bacterium]